MHKLRHVSLGGGRIDWRQRASSLVRPGVEALLLAVVALGCAQAGWSALAPSDAGASSGTSDDAGERALAGTSVQSPFAPALAQGDSGSLAIAATLSNVKLSGVRLADDPARSGAIITLADGAQHAFLIGSEVAPGLTLSEVGVDHITVSYSGGQQLVGLEQPARFSYAEAMMGRSLDVAANVQTAATESDAAWLTQALSQGFVAEGDVHGWRVPAPAPAAAQAAGLREGDIILTVNGVTPGDASALLGAVSSGAVDLEVRHNDGTTTRVTLSAARPT